MSRVGGKPPRLVCTALAAPTLVSRENTETYTHLKTTAQGHKLRTATVGIADGWAGILSLRPGCFYLRKLYFLNHLL